MFHFIDKVLQYISHVQICGITNADMHSIFMSQGSSTGSLYLGSEAVKCGHHGRIHERTWENKCSFTMGTVWHNRTIQTRASVTIIEQIHTVTVCSHNQFSLHLRLLPINQFTHHTFFQMFKSQHLHERYHHDSNKPLRLVCFHYFITAHWCLTAVTVFVAILFFSYLATPVIAICANSFQH